MMRLLDKMTVVDASLLQTIGRSEMKSPRLNCLLSTIYGAQDVCFGMSIGLSKLFDNIDVRTALAALRRRA